MDTTGETSKLSNAWLSQLALNQLAWIGWPCRYHNFIGNHWLLTGLPGGSGFVLEGVQRRPARAEKCWIPGRRTRIIQAIRKPSIFEPESNADYWIPYTIDRTLPLVLKSRSAPENWESKDFSSNRTILGRLDGNAKHQPTYSAREVREEVLRRTTMVFMAINRKCRTILKEK